jgi:hypothetical protein
MTPKNQAFPWLAGRIQKILAVFGQIFQIYVKASKQRIVMLDQWDVKIGLFPNFFPGCLGLNF